MSILIAILILWGIGSHSHSVNVTTSVNDNGCNTPFEIESTQTMRIKNYDIGKL